LPTDDKLGIIFPVVVSMLSPVGLEVNIPPGVSIVGVTVDGSLIQYNKAG